MSNFIPGTGPRDEKSGDRETPRARPTPPVRPPSLSRAERGVTITDRRSNNEIKETGTIENDDNFRRNQAYLKYMKGPVSTQVTPQLDPCRPIPPDAFTCDFIDTSQEVREKTRLIIARGNRPPGEALSRGPIMGYPGADGRVDYRASGRTVFDNDSYEIESAPMREALRQIDELLSFPYFPGKNHVIESRRELQENLRKMKQDLYHQNNRKTMTAETIRAVNAEHLKDYIKVEYHIDDMTLDGWPMYEGENNVAHPTLVGEDEPVNRLLRFWVHLPTLRFMIQKRELKEKTVKHMRMRTLSVQNEKREVIKEGQELGFKPVTKKTIDWMIKNSRDKTRTLEYLMRSASGFVTVIDSKTGDLNSYVSVNKGVLNGPSEHFTSGPQYVVLTRFFFRNGKVVYMDNSPTDKSYCLNNGTINVDFDSEGKLWKFNPPRHDGLKDVTMHNSYDDAIDNHDEMRIRLDRSWVGGDPVTFNIIYAVGGVNIINRTIRADIPDGLIRRDTFVNRVLTNTVDHKVPVAQLLQDLDMTKLFPVDMSFYEGQVFQAVAHPNGHVNAVAHFEIDYDNQDGGPYPVGNWDPQD